MKSLKAERKPRTSFGATAPPFIDYLKDILRRYPDGGQILKELIQNAEDAGATEIVFIHDERSYGDESLWTGELGKYQGPALYAYNNAAFTDEDWESIQATGRSVKRNDPNKVGRFGIGFNSVYHITDVPCIFSSGHLGLLDPQEKLFGKGNGGFKWSLADPDDQETLMTLHDQFQPIQDIVSLVSEQEWSKVITEDQRFEGTLFRFPLRNEASDISDNLYDSDRVVQLFDSFIADADLSLLFLKNVTSVSLVHVRTDASVNLRLKVTCSRCTDVVLEPGDESIVEGSTSFKFITLSSEDGTVKKKWLVTTCCTKEGNIAKLDSLAERLRFLPQVDLAFPCDQKRDCTDSRLSCFLPLPNNESNKTGLPVYVNACFGLTDNRRHIKWQEEDQKYDEAALWNELLIKEVLPQAYLMILQDAIKLSKDSMLPVSSVYGLWPDITKMQGKDKWYAVALDVLQHLFRQNVPVLSLAIDERQFVSPSEAVLPCTDVTSPEIVAAVKRTLVSSGEHLVTLPDRIARAIKETYPDISTLRHATPTFLREVLRRIGLHNISKADKLSLLEYILSDGNYRELEGLQLLPMSDGTFRSFTDKEEDIAFIDSNEFPRVLLPGCESHFIPDDLSAPCRTHLKDLASKNLSKVLNIDAVLVAEYAKRYLPKGWEQTTMKHVTWEIGSSQHPPIEWLQEFWKFLNTHFRELNGFMSIPLIPTKPIQNGNHPVLLARLQQNSTLVFQRSKQTRLPDQIAQMVERVGGTVVRGEEWLKHEDLDSYVLCPSPKNVVKVFVNLDSEQVIRGINAASYREREELKDYLSSLDCLSDREKAVLSKLPLFQTMAGSCVAAQSKQAVLFSNGLAVPADLPMPDSVVQCATEADRRLLQLLNIHLLDTAQAATLLIDSIERGTVGKEDSGKIMTWILQHGNILFSQNQALKRRCKDLNFIEMNGELKKTSSFFDPRKETFKVLFESAFFPPPLYTQTPQMLESLTDLGLLSKEMDVTSRHVLHAATLIEKSHILSQNEAVKRSQVLIRLLEATDALSRCSKQELDHLLKLKWIPCVKPCDEKKQSKKKSQRNGFFCPHEIRDSMYEDIVGHAMPLVGQLSERVSSKLGLRCLPPPEKVMENLSVLTSVAETMVNPDTDMDFKRKLHNIYKHMQDHISKFSQVMNKDTRWLWTDKQFVSPRDLVLEYPPHLDLSSYIEKVPKEFLPYKTLLMKFGLRKLLSDEEVVDILHRIKQTIEGRQKSSASSSELKVSIEILNWMWREKKTVRDDIPVPVITESQQYILKPLSTAVFCDISKEGLRDLKYIEEEIQVVHEEIPKATAEWLNIPLLSTRILDPELVGIEQCGQSEPITTRIKNILKEYDEENYIFKELIQNAEDAGADTCGFLVDFRVHKDPPESLIDPDMALCQGPCLWAFNNEQFTKDDWENIVRVGSASKENKVEKIGKFGLGFNTVYHVTDVPSILSGSKLLILDPNVSHLKKHIKTKTNPGIKLDLSKQRHFHWFPGQFRPYQHIFNCNFDRQSAPTPYKGTLIKLPFRTQEEALKSEISKKVYDRHDITTFQQHFTNNSQTHLLFLKNIKTLSIQKITDDASAPPRDDQIKTVLTVSKTMESTMEMPNEMQHKAKEKLINLDEKCKDVIDCCTVSIITITQQQCSGSDVQSWLLYNCLGTKQSLQMALKGNKRARFSLPIGGVAVPLHTDPETGKWIASQTELVGQAFCFLPLSIRTGLPVNVNGSFAVTNNRKGLWESGVKHDWNKALLQDPATTAYVTALSALKRMSENNCMESYCYHTFWPNREKVSDTFKPLADAFFSVIAQDCNAPELFNDGTYWCSMNEAIFLHPSIEEDKNVCALAMEVCQNYAQAPNRVVPLPLWLRKSFKEAGLEKVLQSRTWNWKKMYQEVVFSNLATMNPKSRDALVLHAIDLNISEIDNLLVCYPCIPTQGGQLQYIKKLVNPSGKVACLFEQEGGRLLGGTNSGFRSPKRIQRLLELGMLNDHLPLEDIAERAGKVTHIWRTDKRNAYRHLECIFDLLKSPLHEKDSLYWESLRETEFIPAFPPDRKQTEGTATLWRPTDVFTDKCCLLVNMTQPVVDHSNLKIHHADPVLKLLGVRESPTPETVLQQLHEACRQSKSSNKTTLYKIANECYKFLNQWLHDGGDSTFLSERAASFPFILVGDKFVHVTSVAAKEEFDAKPYLHVLPTAYAGFEKLWECVGVENKFTISQFLTVLQTLHTRYGNKPLSKADLTISCTILSSLSEAKEKKPSDCLIPNEHGVLQPASKLHYNDSPWMPVTPGVTLCHEKIPRVTARHFGIKTTRHQILQNHSVEEISPFAFQFEQREQLTTRIKNIISAYPAKKDILKELLQNADDAEATEIHFVWDKRRHGTQKTFGKRWHQLQGPALCVYNNTVFSDEDLKGIQQLGEGGKHNCPGKTGKYGVGFNSVYHLTDCPSILTGDKLLCISDPNQKYIEGYSEKAPPGRGYNLAPPFKEMYNDVYKSFLPDQFALEGGTMFRLPLRMGAMADNSKISNEAVNERDMEELCSALREDPEGLILFLKNICKIQFYEITADTGELKTIFKVDKSLPKVSSEDRLSFVKHLQNVLQSDKPITPHKTIYSIKISTSDKRESNWVIAEQFGSFKSSSGIEKLPQAAIAAHVSSNPPRKDFRGGAFCSLPLPVKTGLPIHVNGNFEVDSSRRDLWKEDGTSVKAKWNESLKTNIIAPLYADLLHNIRSHVAKVKVVSMYDISCLDDFYLSFFPIVSKDIAQDWHGMIHELYKSIHERALDVIPVLKSSTRTIAHRTIKEFSFEWCNVRDTESTNAPHLVARGSEGIYPILEDLGMRLVPWSEQMGKVWTSFRTANVEVKSVSPSTVRSFLRANPLCGALQTEMDLPINQTLIRDEKRCSVLLTFCLTDVEERTNPKKDISSSVNGLPLLLTKNKVLRVFNSNNPMLMSRYDHLFFGFEKEFADYDTNNKHVTILQECNFVKKLTIPNAVKYLKPLLQRLLQDCKVDPHRGLHVPNETMLKWLKHLWWFFMSQVKSTADTDDPQSTTLSDVKELFSDCCIFPVVCPRLNNTHFLQNMKDMSSVIHSSTDEISVILFKLGCMKLDFPFFTDMGSHFTLLLHCELMNVSDKGSVMDLAYNIKHSEFGELTCTELKELQMFLQSGISASHNKHEYQRKLRSLPLFETIHGQRVRIDGPREVFILKIDTSLMTRFPDLFTLHDSKSIFLKHSLENESLSDKLNIPILTEPEYFLRFILPLLHQLTERQILHCMKMLLSLTHLDNQHRERIISSMKDVKLIRSAHGNFEKASYYFDESVELYAKMLPQERFVPHGFWDELCDDKLKLPQQKCKARKLLQDLGMKHVVSKDEIIGFAHQIESEAKGNRGLKELKQKSSMLLRKALTIQSDGNKQEQDPMCLQCIADIKFIFPLKVREELCNYHRPFAADSTAVTIRGSLLESDPQHETLIWTSMPIIARPLPLKHLQMMKNAGALEQPPPQCVTRNLSNICQSPCGTPEVIRTRADVFRRSYGYLQAIQFESRPLSGLPVVLVENDTKLVKTDETSLQLQNHLEFRPYLYKIPPKDVKYEEFFKKIGIKEEPTVLQYCNVLTAIHAESCDKLTLQPNQQKTVKRAVGQLFQLIKTQERQSPLELETLHLPATDGRLHPSNTLYFNDTVFEPNRLEEALQSKVLLLEKLSECYLDNDIYEHHRLLQLLPQNIRPKMLAQHTGENLVESHMQLCEYGADCEFSGWFDKHLTSAAFRHGLICLIRDHSEGEITQDDAADMCQQTFGSIRIVCCKSLETELQFDEQSLQNTAAENEVYVKKERQSCTFYLRHSDDMAHKVISEVTATLTKEINALLGNKVASDRLQVLGLFLMCDSLQEVQKILAKNGILDSVGPEDFLLNPPVPGTAIPEEWHDSLDMNILNNFEEGEYVGYTTNGEYIYAVIVEQLPAPPGQFLRRYRIQTEQDEPIEVSSLDLYQFKRQKKPKQEKTTCMALEPLAGSVPHTSPTSSPGASSHRRSPASSSPRRPTPASLAEAQREIDQCLAQIWTLPVEERNKAIKRMYLRWHPDKNPDCEQLATEAFKYLQRRIDELTRGKPANSSYPWDDTNFSDFYRQWDQEANRHRRGRERYYQRHRYSHNYNFWEHYANVPRPNREEAQRWCRQARCDLSAASKDTGGGSTEWCLFKVHQAVEKSLIAAEYKRTGQHPGNCSISGIAARVSRYNLQLSTLPQIVDDLKLLGVDAKKTQYPNCHPTPHIPNGQFKSEDETRALDLASELLGKVEAYVN
ncbi:sacsin-like [Diretmus argenteus]